MARNTGIKAIRTLIQRGELNKASTACRRRIDQADDPEARYLLAVITGQLGLYSESVALFEKALLDFPARSDVAYNYGIILQSMGKTEDAIAQWTRATAMNPYHADAQFNLGRAYLDKKMWSEALAPCEAAAALTPENKTALSNLGNVNFRLGRLTQAKYCFNLSVKIDPAYVRGWINLGLTELRGGNQGAAVALLGKAIAIDPENALAHFNLGQALLADGRLSEGFAEIEWRRRYHKLPFPVAGQPPWKGEDPAGKTILLYGEQGQGDVIQFLRYAEPLAERGARVAVSCHSGLVGMARRTRGVADATAYADPPPAFDAYAPLMSLPHLLGLEAFESIPPSPYLTPPEPVALPGRGVRVGLVWAGNPDHDDDVNRSAALADFRPLLDVAGADFFALQVGQAAKQIAEAGMAAAVKDLGAGFRDFADTAAAIQGLDLLVSVDTAAAHLAGAIGKPVWLLLPRVADWRWGRTGEKSPWYPSMRMFRQTGRRDWGPVIGRLAGELDALVRRAGRA